MQIDTSNTVQVSSNLSAAQGRMSLDTEGMAHLIQVLTNLYSDKYLAVLREYSTNARDAHVAAGNEHLPISVTLPTARNPTLVISDNGVGLSRDELLGIYSRYGASTKRNTNTQVGSFGLGSKSAFTIGGQFIVTARKDGQQVSAVFAMDAHGVGTVNILAEHETAEGNGVTISIAVSEPHKMQDAADRFFLAWRPGTVLVDGEQPDSFFSDPASQWISDEILYTRKGGITVVMGAVAYPLPSSAVESVRTRTGLRIPLYEAGLVVFVPIGAVDITPSREGIRDTERSLQAVSAVLKTLPDSLRSRLSEITGDEITRVFASRKLLAAADHLNVKVSSALPDRIRVAPGAAKHFYLSPRGGLKTDDLDMIDAATAHLITVLVGVPAKRSARRHAKQWLESVSSRRMLIMFENTEASVGTLGWFRYGTDSPVETVHFDDIELPSAERSSAESRAITYRVYPGAYMTPSEIKAQSLPVAYGTSHSTSPALAGYLQVVLTNRQNPDVFLRRVPQAVSTSELVNAHIKAQVAALGDTTELSKGYHLDRALNQINYMLDKHASRITHPTFLAATRTAQAYRDLTDSVKILVRSHGHIREEDALHELQQALPLLFLATQSYRTPTNLMRKHLVSYANSAPALPTPYTSAQ